MHQMVGNSFDIDGWELDGLANSRQFSAQWQGLGPTGRTLTEGRLRTEVTSRGDAILIGLEVLLTDSRRPLFEEVLNSLTEAERKAGGTDVVMTRWAYDPTPLISLGALRQLMLDITCTLWGRPGEAISTEILGQSLGPPAILDLTIYSTPVNQGNDIPLLNERIDFGAARLIPGNTPGT